MRWNCPHCGVALAVSDDKIGTGWSFSRCYKCGGFALVRRSDINLIKVDRAPQGERIVLPEGNETMIMNQEAAKRMNRYGAPASEARASGATTAPQSAATNVPPTQVQAAAEALVSARDGIAAERTGQRQAKPIVKPANRRAQPQAQAQAQAQIQGVPIGDAPSITMTSAMMMAGSDAPAPRSVMPPPPSANMLNTQPPSIPAFDMTFPEALPDEPQKKAFWQRILPIGMGVASVITVGSGVYLYHQGQQIMAKARANAAAEIEQDISASTHAAPNRRSVNRSPAIEDRVHQNGGSAPNREAPTPSGIVVQPKSAEVTLRSGPGLEYSDLGKADASLKYVVSEWQDRWFKIVLPMGRGVAWVRNDLVQLTRVDQE